MAVGFSQSWPWVKLFSLCMKDRNRNRRNGGISTHSDVEKRLVLICKRPFQDKAVYLKEAAFLAHIVNKFQRPTVLDLNIRDITASKLFIILLCS